ncbi:patatin-like phospholipase family protein [Treponema pedis]|uniref:patatin-like phospholipase family protein n=1 Tax=Treponema pedis TaxID=409322 RepID=UPI00040C4A88|nr:patatin-like phospholipase family protein [Treponema pedis]
MKWALVLSGGGARGIAYVGMLKAFNELNYPQPNCIVGCSMGAVIGGLYASGMTVNEMISFFSNGFNLSDYVEVSKFSLGHTKISKILQLGAGLNNLINKQGIDSGEKSYTLFKKLSCYQTFEQTQIPFYCNAVDLCEGKEIIFKSGFLADAMRASSSYPGFFSPYRYSGKLFVDGCVRHNTPVWIAKEKGFKNILAVTLGVFKTKPETEFESAISILTRCLETAVSAAGYTKKDSPTYILDLDSNTAAYDFSDPSYLIQLGYSLTMKSKKELDAFFTKGISGYLLRKQAAKKTAERLKHERIF